MSKSKTILCLIINLFIALSTTIIAVIGLTSGAGEGQVGTFIVGIRYLMPFTIDSNIVNGLFALFIFIFCINRLVNKDCEVPKWAIRLQLIGAVGTGLTFIVVLLFLAPMQIMMGRSFFVMFSNDMFFFHFMNPVLAAISFMFLERGHKFTIVDNLLTLLPTICYGIVYTIQVAVTKQWYDFYGFTFGGKLFLAPIVILVILGVTFGIGRLYIVVHNKREV